MKRRKSNDAIAYHAWCHEHGGVCCLCSREFTDLHHFGEAGMGMRGSDWIVARLCRKCHEKYGRRIHGLQRNEEHDTLEAFLLDCVELMSGWLERRGRA